MLRFAKAEDVPKLTALYDQCFPNEHEFAIDFFKNIFPHEKCIAFYNGEIIGMAHLIDVSIECGESLRGLYIFAVGVDERHRLHGIGSEMLKFAEKHARGESCDFLCLIVENERLFDYYEKFGFKKSLFCSKARFSATTVKKTHDKKIVKADAREYLKLSQKFISPPKIYRSENTLKEQFSVYGIEPVFLSEGEKITAGAVFEKLENRLTVYEVLGNRDSALYLLNLSAERLGCTEICLRAPLGMFENSAIGCLKPLSDRASRLGSTAVYANLLFN